MPTRIDTQDILDLTITTNDLSASAVTAAKADLTDTWDYALGSLLYKTPTLDNEVAIKSYVDAAAAGARDPKDAVKVAVDSNITLSGLQTLDGYTVQQDDRVLLFGQTNAVENGLYLASTGSWSRTSDADEDSEVTNGLYTLATTGSTYQGSGFILVTDDPITVGTDEQNYIQFTALGQVIAGAGLTKTGNQLDVGAGYGIIVNADSVALDSTVVPNLTGTNNWSGQNIFTDISGNLFHNSSGLSLFVAGDGITIDSGSNNQIVFSTVIGNPFDSDASYVVLGTTSSLSNERVLTAGFGLTLDDGGANGNVTLNLNTASIPALDQFVFQEVPNGTIGSNNDVFTLLNPATSISSGSIRVYKRGLRMKEGCDYVLSSSVTPDEQSIVFQVGAVPTSGSNLFVDYILNQ